MDTPTPNAELPRYYLHADCFFEPHLVLKGSVVSTTAPPNQFMQPLNDAARVATEGFYDEEFSYIVDDPTAPNKKITIKHKPRADLRPVERPSGTRHTTTVEHLPSRATLAGQSLAEINTIRTAAPLSQRPGPATESVVPAQFMEAGGGRMSGLTETASGEVLKIDQPAPPPLDAKGRPSELKSNRVPA